MAKLKLESLAPEEAVGRCLRVVDGHVRLVIRVVPKSQKERLECNAGQELVLRVNAPPVDGRANERVLALIGSKLQVSQRSLSLVRGETSRVKEIAIEGLSLGVCCERLATTKS